MGTVRLLDCTLRDGGHINQGNFGKNVIKATIDNLVKAKIDVIEAGFLWDTETGDDVARFHTISELKKYLPKDMGNSKISLMADNVDLSHLEPYDGTVEYIRLSFRRTEFEWAEKTFNILKEKHNDFKQKCRVFQENAYRFRKGLSLTKHPKRI